MSYTLKWKSSLEKCSLQVVKMTNSNVASDENYMKIKITFPNSRLHAFPAAGGIYYTCHASYRWLYSTQDEWTAFTTSLLPHQASKHAQAAPNVCLMCGADSLHLMDHLLLISNVGQALIIDQSVPWREKSTASWFNELIQYSPHVMSFFVIVLYFILMLSSVFIYSYNTFTHILQDCFTGNRAVASCITVMLHECHAM